MPRPMLLIELNEFNLELLQQAARDLRLPTIAKILALSSAETTADDDYDSNRLEPWVQWVSVHTGLPARAHGLRHLGEAPGLGASQIWERLSEAGFTSGVWCPMNASRGSAERCLFFLPDPWTFSERAYPERLNAALDLPRYVAKNYLNLRPTEILNRLKKFAGAIAAPRVAKGLAAELPALARDLIRFRGESFVFICFLDYAASLLFAEELDGLPVDFALIFLNSIAHLQHHHWSDGKLRNAPQMRAGLAWIEKALAVAVSRAGKGRDLVVMNAFSQNPTFDEPAWYLYRQRDQAAFLKLCGLNFARVESHMTHDAHVFFDSPEDFRAAVEALNDATVQGERLFLIETYSDRADLLFYRIDFTKDAQNSTYVKINGREIPFFKAFKRVVKRSGKHVRRGSIFTSIDGLPRTLKNYEAFNFILDRFGVRQSSSIVPAFQALDATVASALPT